MASSMLYFSTGDRPTDFNLERLSHLASLDRFDDGAERMNDWLGSVITSISALPKAAAKHFTGYYFLGDSHFNMSAELRAASWRRLAEELRGHVAAAHSDPALKRDGPHGDPDVSDRRETLGEQIETLCDKLQNASWGTREFDAILAAINAVAIGDIRSDVAELRALSSRKRISDLSNHQYWIARHIAHIRLIAGRLHHLGAR